MLCHDTISLVCFCLQFDRYNKDICEVARALNCPEEDRWKEKGWKDVLEYKEDIFLKETEMNKTVKAFVIMIE